MHRIVRLAPAIAALALATGCATIMHGSSQGVSFASTPAGATVWVDNQQRGVTPVNVDLSRKDKHLVRIAMDGYQPYELQMTRKSSGWVWGNLVFGGIPGLAIDAITGALYEIGPDEINAPLARTAVARPDRQTLSIAVVLVPDPSWRKIGQMERVGE